MSKLNYSVNVDYSHIDKTYHPYAVIWVGDHTGHVDYFLLIHTVRYADVPIFRITRHRTESVRRRRLHKHLSEMYNALDNKQLFEEYIEWAFSCKPVSISADLTRKWVKLQEMVVELYNNDPNVETDDDVSDE